MATQQNTISTKNERDRLSEASLEAHYLDTLLTVLEDIFEDIDRLCDLSESTAQLVRPKARIGLNITYMAQDKLGAVKQLTDGAERGLYQAERLAISEPAGRA